MSVLKLKNVRLAFPNLFVAQAFQGEDKSAPKFNASFLIDPNDPQVKEIKAAMKAVAEAKWGKKAEAIYTELEKKDRICLRNGDDKKDFEGYEGNLYLSAANAAKPLVLDRDKTELTQQSGKPYSGCFVNTTVDIWAQDNGFGKRINATLTGVQFYKDGDAFAGGKPADPDDFDDLGDTGEDENLEDVA